MSEVKRYSVPHMRGDEPPQKPKPTAFEECSPHAWG